MRSHVRIGSLLVILLALVLALVGNAPRVAAASAAVRVDHDAARAPAGCNLRGDVTGTVTPRVAGVGLGGAAGLWLIIFLGAGLAHAVARARMR